MFRDHTKRMTAAEYAAFAGRELPNTADTSNPPFALPPDAKTARFALGRLKTGEMNKTEAAYAAYLAERQHAGAILWHKFEGVKLRLADNTFYTADFAVLGADLAFEIHEVKGFWQDDARVKIKVAASLYPFRFLAMKPRAKKHGGGWEVEEF
jgi:hypothetical protein